MVTYWEPPESENAFISAAMSIKHLNKGHDVIQLTVILSWLEYSRWGQWIRKVDFSITCPGYQSLSCTLLADIYKK